MGTVIDRAVPNDVYKRAKTRLFFLDYDGTLVGFKAVPSESKPDSRLLGLLERLAEDPRNTIVIISGRDKQALDNWLGRLPVFLIAEHGFFTKQPGRPWKTSSPVASTWKNPVKAAMQKSVSAVAGSLIEEKDSSLVWHFRAAGDASALAEIPRLMERLGDSVAAYELTVIQGHKNVEVRLSQTNKGLAAGPWLEKQKWDFILAAGDDVTDEDLFSAMPKPAFTVKVGPGDSKASSRLSSPEALRELLESLYNS